MYHRFQFGILLGCVSKGNVYTVSVAVLDQAGKVVNITLMFSFIGDKYSTQPCIPFCYLQEPREVMIVGTSQFMVLIANHTSWKTRLACSHFPMIYYYSIHVISPWWAHVHQCNVVCYREIILIQVSNCFFFRLQGLLLLGRCTQDVHIAMLFSNIMFPYHGSVAPE